jgi:hypothetical protein
MFALLALIAGCQGIAVPYDHEVTVSIPPASAPLPESFTASTGLQDPDAIRGQLPAGVQMLVLTGFEVESPDGTPPGNWVDDVRLDLSDDEILSDDDETLADQSVDAEATDVIVPVEVSVLDRGPFAVLATLELVGWPKDGMDLPIQVHATAYVGP